MEANNNSLIVFAPDSQVAVKTLASGGRSITVLSRKAYGEKTGYKGAELKRKHNEYLCQIGVKGNEGVSAMIARGEVLVHKISERMDRDGEKVGLNVVFKMANQVDTSADPRLAAQQCSDAELLAILKQRETDKANKAN